VGCVNLVQDRDKGRAAALNIKGGVFLGQLSDCEFYKNDFLPWRSANVCKFHVAFRTVVAVAVAVVISCHSY
jgi:hypothetical protein